MHYSKGAHEVADQAVPTPPRQGGGWTGRQEDAAFPSQCMGASVSGPAPNSYHETQPPSHPLAHKRCRSHALAAQARDTEQSLAPQ